MMPKTNSQIKKRNEEGLGFIQCSLKDLNNSKNNLLFITAPNDQGVIENGGRQGARYAARCLINQFKKLSLSSELTLANWSVASLCQEFEQFTSVSQLQNNFEISLDKLNTNFSQCDHIFLGGGHDHIYPWLKSIKKRSNKKLVILNIDAHADTRLDANPHSGTPFRQADSSLDFELIEYGLHPFTNSISTLTKLRNKTDYIWLKDIQEGDGFIQLCSLLEKTLNENCDFVLSIDVDAFDSSLVSAVSAVNHQGLRVDEILKIINLYKSYLDRYQLDLRVGFFEFNPLYEDLNLKGARFISSLLYKLFLK